MGVKRSVGHVNFGTSVYFIYVEVAKFIGDINFDRNVNNELNGETIPKLINIQEYDGGFKDYKFNNTIEIFRIFINAINNKVYFRITKNSLQ